MTKLKIDKKFKHHYIFSVKAKPMKSDNPGEMYLKHGPIHFTNKDVVNVQNALILSQDKLFKTDRKQALKNFKCTDVVGSIGSLQLAANANECTVHHFSSEFELDDNWFVELVKRANASPFDKELLMKAKVKI
jgi:hypothetical protein